MSQVQPTMPQIELFNADLAGRKQTDSREVVEIVITKVLPGPNGHFVYLARIPAIYAGHADSALFYMRSTQFEEEDRTRLNGDADSINAGKSRAIVLAGVARVNRARLAEYTDADFEALNLQAPFVNPRMLRF